MYIFEFITNILKGKKYRKHTNYNPEIQDDIIENPQECEHLFMPLDESKEMFACKYCGLVVSKDALSNNRKF